MSTVIATSVLPDSTANDTLTFGATGDSVVISGDSLNLNTLQDSGGNNIFVSDGSGTITSKNSGFPGAYKLITTSTFTNQSSVSFTTQLTSTYDVYIFKFIDINPATDATRFRFQCSTDGGSNYNTVVTSTTFKAYHTEGGSGALTYDIETDQQQGTSMQDLTGDIGSASDECGVGELHLFTPSSTSYLKHFQSIVQSYDSAPQSRQTFAAGYFTTTSALNAITFDMLSGNFDGTIKLNGISKS